MTEKNDLQMPITKEEGNKNLLSKQKMSEINIKRLIAKYMRKFGMPCHLKGYEYVTEAIFTCIIAPEKIHFVTKVLYVEVAKKYKTTTSRVERGIRHAIEVAWERGDLELIEEIFGNTISAEKAKPTNSEFIALIAEDIRINNHF